MKWIGQHIFDYISRFRNDVYVDAKILDSSGSAGSSNDILTSTGTTVVWTNRTFTYTKTNAANTWVITHNLNSYPSVTVVDTGGSVVRGEVVYNSINQLTITFFSNSSAVAVDGKAYLN